MKKKPCLGAALRILLIVLVSIALVPLLTTYNHSPGDEPEENPPSPMGMGRQPDSNPLADEPAPPISAETAGPPETPDPNGGNSGQGEEGPPPSQPPQIGDLPIENIRTTDIELAEKLDSIAEDYNCIGVSLAAFDPQLGYLTYQYGLADTSEKRPVGEETRFRVASLSKIAGTVIVMALVDKGMLDLDEDISVYLGYSAKNPSYPETPITARMLIQHTSSIYNTDEYESGSISFGVNTTRELLGRASTYRDRKPGEEHEYSDLAYTVLGRICEVVSGKLFDALAKEILFDPLGIDAAFVPANLQNKDVASQYNSRHELRRSAQAHLREGPNNNETQHASIVGNLTITALDYAKFLNMLTHGGVYDEAGIISGAAVREMHRANVPGEYGYMQGLSVRLVKGDFFGEDVYYHTGSAYGTLAQFFYSVETKRIVVVVTTGSNSERGIYHSVKVCTDMSELVWRR